MIERQNPELKRTFLERHVTISSRLLVCEFWIQVSFRKVQVTKILAVLQILMLSCKDIYTYILFIIFGENALSRFKMAGKHGRWTDKQRWPEWRWPEHARNSIRFIHSHSASFMSVWTWLSAPLAPQFFCKGSKNGSASAPRQVRKPHSFERCETNAIRCETNLCALDILMDFFTNKSLIAFLSSRCTTLHRFEDCWNFFASRIRPTLELPMQKEVARSTRKHCIALHYASAAHGAVDEFWPPCEVTADVRRTDATSASPSANPSASPLCPPITTHHRIMWPICKNHIVYSCITLYHDDSRCTISKKWCITTRFEETAHANVHLVLHRSHLEMREMPPGVPSIFFESEPECVIACDYLILTFSIFHSIPVCESDILDAYSYLQCTYIALSVTPRRDFLWAAGARLGLEPVNASSLINTLRRRVSLAVQMWQSLECIRNVKTRMR